jgi:hypothetical protein
VTLFREEGISLSGSPKGRLAGKALEGTRKEPPEAMSFSGPGEIRKGDVQHARNKERFFRMSRIFTVMLVVFLAFGSPSRGREKAVYHHGLHVGFLSASGFRVKVAPPEATGSFPSRKEGPGRCSTGRRTTTGPP